MSSATSSDINSSNQVRDEDENYDLTETLNESEVSVHCSNGGSLEYAVQVGDIELVELRIRQGADVNGSGRKGSSPLHVAAWNGHPEIIELLINNGARLDSELNGPLKNGYTPLHLASLNNKIECVKVLLKYGASVTPKSADAHHPIHIAVFKNYVKVAALLLDNGADVNLRFNNKFFYNQWDESIFWKDMDLTLLHCSIARKYKEMTALLLEHGADIHLKTRSNKTSLMHAVEANDSELVKSLLANGANPNDRDIYGKPVLFFTVLNAYNHFIYYNNQEYYHNVVNFKITKRLYAAGADVNAKFGLNGSSNSLVYYTCMYGQVGTTQFILRSTNFDWRNIDVATVKATKIIQETISPHDRRHLWGISYLMENLDISKTELLYYIYSRHLIGFPVKKKVLSALHSLDYDGERDPDRIKSAKRYLKKAIRYTKQTTIGNSKISLWYLLTCKMTELVRLSIHKDFQSLCLKDYFDDSLYYYNDMIEFRWKSAVRRSTSIARSSKIMFNLLYKHLPYDCCETIATFFDDKELENFIKNFSNDIVC